MKNYYTTPPVILKKPHTLSPTMPYDLEPDSVLHKGNL